MTEVMKHRRLAPWFGADSAVAEEIGAKLRSDWCGVLFCGGACVLPHIKCRGGVAGDIHRHVMNLCRVIRSYDHKQLLVERLREGLFHPDELAAAQSRCIDRERAFEDAGGLFGVKEAVAEDVDVDWAVDYFIAVWMGRGGKAGTKAEFLGRLSTRFNANGGGSNTRYRNVVEAVDAWHAVTKRWEFETLDAFRFLDKVKDAPAKALYADPPWPDAGNEYRHRFTDEMHRVLSQRLGSYKEVRVVVRYGDHPLIRDLYPTSKWNVIEQVSRDQDNKEVCELLIINGPSYAKEPTTC